MILYRLSCSRGAQHAITSLWGDLNFEEHTISVPFMVAVKSKDLCAEGMTKIPACIAYIAPRAVAYFEVSITRLSILPESVIPRPDVECVAIGLATEYFKMEEKMPGWDCDSYG